MTLLSREEAWERISALAEALPAEEAELRDAVGRITAAPVTARIDVPPFERSAMDGYALRAEDTPGTLRVVGEVAAGDAAGSPLEPGTARRIFTGGAIPPGADSVERQEVVERDGDRAIFPAARHGQHVRFRGEDIRDGTVLLGKYERVTVQALNAIASGGAASVPVHRRARVAIMTTGDELVAPGEPLPAGAIYESTSVALEALVVRAGAVPELYRRVPDAPAATTAAVAEALERADVLLVAGGVSVGEHDHVKAAFAAAGVEELFWGVRIKPGKPLFCGRAGERWVFGLPGNPLSAFVTYLAFVEPLLRRLHGDLRRRPALHVLTTTRDIGPEDGRTTYLTATVDGDEVTPTEAQGSAMTLALAQADGFIVADRAYRAGDFVDFLPLY